jgi:hypothetical protein
MLAVKIISSNFSDNFTLQRSIQNIKKFLTEKISKKINTISSSNSTEFISGTLSNNDDGIVTELTFKKVIKIDPLDLEDRQKLDKYINEIRYFCEQVSKIDSLQYLPINFRDRDKDD